MTIEYLKKSPKTSSTDEELEKIVEAVKEYGYHPEVVKGKSKTIVGAVGDQKEKQQHMNLLGQLPGVEAVVPITQPHKLGSREFKKSFWIRRNIRSRYD